MIKGKFNVICDLQWGSVGKGLMSGYLGSKHLPEHISTTSMANAGHTIIHNGQTFIAKALPAPAFLNKTITSYNPTIWIGPSAAFHVGRMVEEIEICGLTPDQVNIHPRAGVITEEHRNIETDRTKGTAHIASTMQGCGAFMSDKIMRRRELKLAQDYDELKPFIANNFSLDLMAALDRGETCLHEGSQGFSLDIHHGSHYPQCTSRQTTAVQNLADMGLSISYMGDVYGCLRSLPIRVGNIYDDGKRVGYSGDCYPDQEEITWDDVKRQAGFPSDFELKEYTTVTKRLRRIFTFSPSQVLIACKINGVTRLALNFANYIDYDCANTNGNDFNKLPERVVSFVVELEANCGLPVTLIGTGPNNDHVWEKPVDVAVSSESVHSPSW